MSGNSLYDPDQSALDTRWTQPWSEAFRAQRDVGLRIPVNFVTVPAVSLSQACFSHHQYEHNAFKKCFSNLLGVGFRRFTIDAYWDSLQSSWSLCPVQLPSANNGGGNDAVTTSSGSLVMASTDTVSARIPDSTAAPLTGLGLVQRQDAVQSTSAPTLSSAQRPSPSPSASHSIRASPSAKPTVISFPSNSGPPLLQIGRYNCTVLMTLDLLTGLLEDFLDATSTTTGASLLLLTLNVHAASSILNPNAPAPHVPTTQLPSTGTLLSDAMKGNVSSITYTPALLQAQRSNLNDSWYNVEPSNQPLSGYYNIMNSSQGNSYTLDGWPTEAFVEFKKFNRLSIGYGTVDPQMQLYNIDRDLDYMFPPGALTSLQSPSIASDGQVSSGCLFAASDTGVTSQLNSSFAIATAPALEVGSSSDLMTPIPAVANLDACGIAALLNQTLGGATADKNPLPYAAYVHSTLWSWAPGEPLNVSAHGSEYNNRCATMTSSPYHGRWRVTDCTNRYRVACRIPGQAYSWQISSDSYNYFDAHGACHAPYAFDVPHTSLENAHLAAAWKNDDRRTPNETIYIDLNSLSVAECWVSGANGTCPYLSTEDSDQARIVIVPTVAAVIIFVLAASTFFVKCAANRRETKRCRRRKLMGGWEYEGVPS
ncbi:Maintenance of telomere capping protein 6 [Pleosporales sp. CAS-2024a]